MGMDSQGGIPLLPLADVLYSEYNSVRTNGLCGFAEQLVVLGQTSLSLVISFLSAQHPLRKKPRCTILM